MRPATTGRSNVCTRIEAKSGDLVTVGKEELGMGDFLSPVLAG